MVKGDEAATVPSSAFFVESGDVVDVEQGFRNGSEGASGAEARKDKAELLSIVVSRPGADVQLMEPVPKDKQLTLDFPNISAWVPDLFGPNSTSGSGGIMSSTWKKLTKRRSTRDSKAKERQVRYTIKRSHQIQLLELSLALFRKAETSCQLHLEHLSEYWNLFSGVQMLTAVEGFIPSTHASSYR